MMVEASVATPAGFSRSRIDTARAPTGLIVGTKWEHCTLGQREHQELEAIKINQNQVRRRDCAERNGLAAVGACKGPAEAIRD
jgi:hypothetical protein